MSKLVYGKGLNDSTEPVSVVVNGKQVVCKIYTKWKNMLARCYDKNRSKRNDSYADCEVSLDWLTFSKFKKWVIENDAAEKHLDKDLLVKGNKLYCHTTCIAVSKDVNMFMCGNPVGISGFEGVSMWNGKYKAYASGTTKRFIGTFDTPEEAHAAWKAAKHKLALSYAEKETDERVAEALRLRYA